MKIQSSHKWCYKVTTCFNNIKYLTPWVISEVTNPILCLTVPVVTTEAADPHLVPTEVVARNHVANTPTSNPTSETPDAYPATTEVHDLIPVVSEPVGPPAPTQNPTKSPGIEVTEGNEVNTNNGGSEILQGPGVTQGFLGPSIASEGESQSVPFEPMFLVDATSGVTSQSFDPNVTRSPTEIHLPPGVTLPNESHPGGVLLPSDIFPITNPGDIFFNQIMGSLNSYNETTDLVSKIW